MRALTLSEDYARLELLSGAWIGEDTLYPSPLNPEGGKALVRYQNELILDGFVLTSDCIQERDGQPVYRGFGTFGWNEEQRCYLMMWADNQEGMAPCLARGVWTTDGFSFEDADEYGCTRYTYDFLDEGELKIRQEFTGDGELWTPLQEGRYIREEDA